jgi:hypothetical protein
LAIDQSESPGWTTWKREPWPRRFAAGVGSGASEALVEANHADVGVVESGAGFGCASVAARISSCV